MKKLDKPIGLYILTVLDFLILGVLPFFGNIMLIRGSEEDFPFIIVFIWLFLPVFTAASAVWAWTGDNNGSIALLIFVSLNMLWGAFNYVNFIAYDSEGQAKGFGYATNVLLRTVFWVGINWWYLNRKDVIAYFRQQSQAAN